MGWVLKIPFLFLPRQANTVHVLVPAARGSPGVDPELRLAAGSGDEMGGRHSCSRPLNCGLTATAGSLTEELDFEPDRWAVAAQAKAGLIHSDFTKTPVCLSGAKAGVATIIPELPAVRTLVTSCVVSAARASKVISTRTVVNRCSLFLLFLGKQRDRDILQSSVHCLNARHSWSWARSEPGAWNSTQVFHVGGST